MKINWGWRIFAVYFVFIVIVAGMIWFTANNTNDKVIENYYEAEIKFSDHYDKMARNEALTYQPQINVDSAFIKIFFPDFYQNQEISGKILLYRPDNKNADFTIPLVLSNNTQVIPTSALKKGKWIINVDWFYNQSSYFFKKEIMVK